MRWLVWPQLAAFSEVGHLILRVGIGLMMILHGMPKVEGGPAKWERLGHATRSIGIDFAPTFFGAAAAFTELVGGALLVMGLGTRPAALFLALTMLVATTNHLQHGDGVSGASHAIELGFVFVGLLFMGGGYYSLDRHLGARR
jgi:putative oxidoreductase